MGGVSICEPRLRTHQANDYDGNNDDENGDGDGGDGEPDDGVGQSNKRFQRNARAARREEKNRQASNTADSQTPDYADMILALWMHNARKGQRQARAMKAEKTQEKVRTWLDSTND